MTPFVRRDMPQLIGFAIISIVFVVRRSQCPNGGPAVNIEQRVRAG